MSFRRMLLAALFAVIVTGCFFDYPDPTVDASSITFNDLAVHDPAVIRDEDAGRHAAGIVTGDRVFQPGGSVSW